MEYTIIKVGAFLKWIFPAALGAGIAVWLKRDATGKEKFIMFILGTGAAVIIGGAVIDYYSITIESIKGVMYFGCGVWGIGLIIQINNKFPEIVKEKLDKWMT